MCPDDMKAAIREALEPLREDVKLVKHLLTGNGEPEKGALMRLDRVEQTEKSRAKALWIMFTAAVGALVTSIITALKQSSN